MKSSNDILQKWGDETKITFLINQLNVLTDFHGPNYATNTYETLFFLFNSDNTTSPIAFSAYADVHRTYNKSDIVLFDKITTNLGQSYNPDNGIFICPFSGVYIFSLTTLSREYHYMGGSITIESRTLGSTWGEDDRDNIEAQGSVTVVSECFPGQRVWVRTLADDMEMYGDTNGWYSVFSGLLFHAY